MEQIHKDPILSVFSPLGGQVSTDIKTDKGVYCNKAYTMSR
jgi:hypothetical protein